MRAAVFTGSRTVEIQDVPEPVADQGEVIATVLAVGICGSEIEAYSGTSVRRRPPLIMGHEMVVAIEGQPQRYFVNPFATCGRCNSCTAGDTNLCESRNLMSLHRSGGFAERVSVRRKDLFEISDTVPTTVAALVEPAATAQNALDVPGGIAGKSVLIIGCGSLGLLAIQIALASGASRVTGCDVVASRRDIAASFGAHAVAEVAAGDRSDVVIDMVGSQVTRRLAVESCASGGYIRFVGLLSEESSLPVVDIIGRGLHVDGVYAYGERHIVQVIDLLEKGRLDLDPMITIGRLEDAPAYFESLATDPGKWIKIVMQP